MTCWHMVVSMSFFLQAGLRTLRQYISAPKYFSQKSRNRKRAGCITALYENSKFTDFNIDKVSPWCSGWTAPIFMFWRQWIIASQGMKLEQSGNMKNKGWHLQDSQQQCTHLAETKVTGCSGNEVAEWGRTIECLCSVVTLPGLRLYCCAAAARENQNCQHKIMITGMACT